MYFKIHLYLLLFSKMYLFYYLYKYPIINPKSPNPQIRNPNLKQAAMDPDPENLISSIQIAKLDEAIGMYTQYSDFAKPFKCILDANLFAHENGFNIGMVQSFFKDNSTEFYMTPCLKTKFDIYNSFLINKLPSIEIPAIRELRCTHERNAFKTNCIKELIGDYNEGRYVVVTADRQLFDELNDGDSLKVIALLYRNDDLYMREPSRYARSIDHLILRDDYIRMMLRANLLKLKEEDTGVGGDSMFAALSCVLKSLVPLNVDLKEMITAQIRFKCRMYLPLFKDDESALLSYVKNLSSKETWGDSITLQAAADLFTVQISVLSGCSDQKVMEWYPQMQKSVTRVVFLSYLDGFRYGALHKYQERLVFIPPEEDKRVDLLYRRDVHVPKLHCEGFLNLKGDHSHLLGVHTKANEAKISQLVGTRLEMYSFYEVEMQGDGNCCFRCLSYYFRNKNQNKFEDVKEELLQQIEEHPELYREVVFDNYVKNMSRPNAHGDNIVLQACADLKDCRVVSIAPTPHEVFYEISPKGSSLKTVAKNIILTDLGYHNNAAEDILDIFGS